MRTPLVRRVDEFFYRQKMVLLSKVSPAEAVVVVTVALTPQGMNTFFRF